MSSDSPADDDGDDDDGDDDDDGGDSSLTSSSLAWYRRVKQQTDPTPRHISTSVSSPDMVRRLYSAEEIVRNHHTAEVTEDLRGNTHTAEVTEDLRGNTHTAEEAVGNHCMRICAGHSASHTHTHQQASDTDTTHSRGTLKKTLSCPCSYQT